MDRPISEEEKRLRKKKIIIKWSFIAAIIVIIAILFPIFMRQTVKRSSIIINTVDKGTIATSLSASGRVEPERTTQNSRHLLLKNCLSTLFREIFAN